MKHASSIVLAAYLIAFSLICGVLIVADARLDAERKERADRYPERATRWQW